MLPPDHSPVPSFDDILESSPLPPPGPDFYAARRVLWLTPRPVPRPSSSEPSKSRQRLEQLLSARNAAEGDYAWQHGLKKVWKTLDAGGKLKKRLPLALIIKIIHAAWLQDDTWPAGAVAPEPDDVLPDNLARPESHPPIPSLSSSGATTPWMTTNANDIEVDNTMSAFMSR